MVAPGDRCPSCERRVPLPKKSTSPTSEVVSLRTPPDTKDQFRETLEAVAEHWGLLGKPFHLYWTINYMLAEALAAPPKELG